jgi:predicted enzyme related to lactoylglutathione lyase
MTASIGSLLVGSSQVDAMKAWYRQAFDAPVNDMGAIELGAVQFFVEEHSEVSGPAKDPARILINVDVDDCRKYEARLEEMGATWIRKVEKTDHALIGTVADPDGNYVQIIQWGG